MGYQEAMEAAGATVIEYKEFGSYQGTWIAKVSFQGNEGYVEGAYGSCSYCDAFQSEFDSWNEENKPDYKERLSEFGEGCLCGLVTLDHLISIYQEKCKGDYAWDDDKEILAWLESQRG